MFDPKTMKLRNFLEKTSQVAGNTFAENAQRVTHASFTPNSDQAQTLSPFVLQLEQKLELNGLDEGDCIPIDDIPH